MKKLILSSLLVMAAATFSLRSQQWPECAQSGDTCFTREGQTCCINCGDSDSWQVTCKDGTTFIGCLSHPPSTHICDSDGGVDNS